MLSNEKMAVPKKSEQVFQFATSGNWRGSGISYKREKYDKTFTLKVCLGSLKRGRILRVYLNYKNKKLKVKKFIKLQKEAGDKVDFNTAQYQRARGKKD